MSMASADLNPPLRRIIYRLAKAPLISRLLIRTVPPAVLWRSLAQVGEMEFHRTNVWRTTEEFTVRTDKLFRWMGLSPTDFDGELLVDLGAGSRLRTAFFDDPRVVVIEPLADRFRAEIDWCDLDDAERVHSVSAETFIRELEGQVAGVVSINVLDHCFEFEQIVSNVFRYLRPGGRAILSFDSHDVADAMHPLVLNEDRCSRIFEDVGFAIEECRKGLGPLGDGYGHGEALTYYLRKRGAGRADDPKGD